MKNSKKMRLVGETEAGTPKPRKIKQLQKDSLLSKLQALEWNFESDSVQDYWNELEIQLVGVADEVAPYRLSNLKTVIEPIPPVIKHK